MRSGLLAAIALALAGVAEVQWAIVFSQSGQLFSALMVLIAGLGMGIAAFGYYADAQGRNPAAAAGFALAATAHAFYVAAYWPPDVAGFNTLAAIGAAAGLLVATAGARQGAAGLKVTRAGLAVATVAAILWIVGDRLLNETRFMFGNVMAPVGWGLAALFLGHADDEP